MSQDLVCKCGYDKFLVATNKKAAMCPKCGKIYDNKGKEIKTVQQNKGYTFHIPVEKESK